VREEGNEMKGGGVFTKAVQEEKMGVPSGNRDFFNISREVALLGERTWSEKIFFCNNRKTGEKIGKKTKKRWIFLYR